MALEAFGPFEPWLARDRAMLLRMNQIIPTIASVPTTEPPIAPPRTVPETPFDGSGSALEVGTGSDVSDDVADSGSEDVVVDASDSLVVVDGADVVLVRDDVVGEAVFPPPQIPKFGDLRVFMPKFMKMKI